MAGEWGKIVDTVEKIRDESVRAFLADELLKASSDGRPEIARYLLSAGANPNSRGRDGKTALQRAAAMGNPETARILCEAGAEALIAGEDGSSALSDAMGALPVTAETTGLVEAALFIEGRMRAEAIAREAAAEERRRKDVETIKAELDRERRLASVLLGQARDEMRKAVAGDLAVLSEMLFDDARVGDFSMIEAAVRINPAVVNARDADGNTLLHVLAGRTDPDRGGIGEGIAKRLIGLGADVNAVGKDGCTALHLAAGRGWRAGLVRILIGAGADLEIRDGAGHVPGSYIRTRGSMDAYNEAVSEREALAMASAGMAAEDASEGGLTD